uniref:Uncharacterized protein n=1 Tax=Cacopsylla melanoneura TaxID=428564 RepID=A0A8D8YBB8_9HEMI
MCILEKPKVGCGNYDKQPLKASKKCEYRQYRNQRSVLMVFFIIFKADKHTSLNAFRSCNNRMPLYQNYAIYPIVVCVKHECSSKIILPRQIQKCLPYFCGFH